MARQVPNIDPGGMAALARSQAVAAPRLPLPRSTGAPASSATAGGVVREMAAGATAVLLPAATRRWREAWAKRS